jgi:hypothetical protein
MPEKKEVPTPKLDWRFLILTGVIFFGIGIGVFIYGVQLRAGEENFSHYWVLAAILVWGGANQVQKGIQRKEVVKKKPS